MYLCSIKNEQVTRFQDEFFCSSLLQNFVKTASLKDQAETPILLDLIHYQQLLKNLSREAQPASNSCKLRSKPNQQTLFQVQQNCMWQVYRHVAFRMHCMCDNAKMKYFPILCPVFTLLFQ